MSWDAHARPRRALLWLNLVCLDAPLVAICWQWLFARSFHFILTAPEMAALFLTAWFIYLVDRFSDSIFLAADVPKSAREVFCQEHRQLWFFLVLSIALVDAGFVWFRLDSVTRTNGLILSTAAVLYLLVNNRFSRIWTFVPIKEITIGILFAAGTLLVFASHLTGARWTIGSAAMLFAVLCSLNCISIAFWERNLDLAQSKHSLATLWPRARSLAPIVSTIVAVVSALLGFLDPRLYALSICLGFSALLLALLNFLPFSRDERTALADLVLLTPFVFFVMERIL
ncbi:MAG: hypothetical protein ACREIW_10780 [Chthoniobacterales bacterium]